MRGIACMVAAVAVIAGSPAGAEPRHRGIVIIDGRHDAHRHREARQGRHPGPRVIGLGRGRGIVDDGFGAVGFDGAPDAVPFDAGPDGALGPETDGLAGLGGGAVPDTYEQVRPKYYQEPTYEHSAPPVIYRVPSGRAVSPLPPVSYCGGYDDDCPGRRRVRVYGGY